MRRTWSKIGHTPVLDADGGHRHKVSVIGGISVSPTAQRLGFYFATEPDGFFTAEKVVPFLRDLLKHLRGHVIVVWDRGNNHKGPVIREFLRKNRRLHLEMLPPWAPVTVHRSVVPQALQQSRNGTSTSAFRGS